MLTPLEEHIRTVFSRILDTHEIDVNRSFFEQGGTSLKVLQVVYLLQQNVRTASVDINLFFDTLSVTRLAQAIEAAGQQNVT